MSSYKAYQCLCELGKGSYGSVTKNRHILTGDIVAIKCFLTDNKDFAAVKRSVLLEGSALRELRHENVVRLFHVFMENSTFYMAFEYVEKTLLDLIRDAPKKLLGCSSETKSFAFQLFRALSFIHSHNFVHRDVKPENILVTNENVLKLADFGFATRTAYAGQTFSTYIATRWYRAPELLTGDYFYGKGVDVWAAGAVIVEMILGQPMAAGTEDSEQMAKTVSLVGRLPRYMLERMRKIYATFANQGDTIPRFAGLEELLEGQTESFINLVKLCLEPDPQLRAAADSLVYNDLFTCEDIQFIPTLVTEIRQSVVLSSRTSAVSYRSFLKKRDLYQKASRDFLCQDAGSTVAPAVFSNYRQLGLDEQVLRLMADMIIRERKLVPDFLSQSPELSESPHEERGGHLLEQQRRQDVMEARCAMMSQQLSNFNQLGPSFLQSQAKVITAATKPQQVHPAFRSDHHITTCRSPESSLGYTVGTPNQLNNPWNEFSVKKIFPVATLSQPASSKSKPLQTSNNQNTSAEPLQQAQMRRWNRVESRQGLVDKKPQFVARKGWQEWQVGNEASYWPQKQSYSKQTRDGFIPQNYGWNPRGSATSIKDLGASKENVAGDYFYSGERNNTMQDRNNWKWGTHINEPLQSYQHKANQFSNQSSQPWQTSHSGVELGRQNDFPQRGGKLCTTDSEIVPKNWSACTVTTSRNAVW